MPSLRVVQRAFQFVNGDFVGMQASAGEEGGVAAEGLVVNRAG